MKYANLHFHSTHSDGGYRPAHLALLAKQLGYKAVALTDHDVLSGIPELFAAAKVLGLEAISGVEFYGELGDRANFHIVGLDFDIQNKRMIEFSKHLTDLRNQHTKKQFDYAVERGVLRGITWNDVVLHNRGCEWYCNDQVFIALDKMGLIPFAESDDARNEAFFSKEAHSVAADIMKKMCTSADEVISVIHEAGGIAILAHPMENAADFVPELADLGLDGIEVSHPLLLENEIKRAYHAAVEYGLYCSGGTDHNGIMSACYGSARGGRIERADETYSGAEAEDFHAIKNRTHSK